MEYIKEIGGILIGLGMFINAIFAALTYMKTLHTVATIETLEKNTNSIKDALVKVTGEAEHAKGVLQGRTETQVNA